MDPAIRDHAWKPQIGILFAISQTAHRVLGGLPFRRAVGCFQRLETLSGELRALDLNQSGDDLALKLVRKRGKYVQMGLPGEPLIVDFEKVAYKELSVSGGVGQRRPAWKRALKLMERGLIPSSRRTGTCSIFCWPTGTQSTVL